MSEALLLESISRSKFQDRLVPAPDGRILMLSKDCRRASWFTAAEIDALNEEISAAVNRTGTMLRRSLYLTIPFAICVLSITSYFKLAKSIDALGQVASFSFCFLTFAGLPLFMLFRHYLALKRAMAKLETRVAGKRWDEAPPLVAKRRLDALEMVGLLLVGPNIVASLICAIDPDLLRNTPWTRSTLDPITLLVAIFLLGRRAMGRSGRQFDADHSPRVEPAPATGPRRRTFGRRV